MTFYDALAEFATRHAGTAPWPGSPDLTAYELGVYSQNGEDGVIAEVLRRIGPGRREFVEFGVEHGVEGNCVALADVCGWGGLFLEADEDKARGLAWKYRDNPRVRTAQATVTAESIDALFAEHGVSAEPDIVSIDVDGNDLWLWRALTHARPRLLIVEYNANLDQRRPLVQPYDPGWRWGGTDYFGASLAALEVVGREKGYSLVHTELAGVNAFFVRDDLVHHFEGLGVPRRPANYDGRGGGHPHGEGRYVELG
jgi:hypothetical protein